MSNSIDLFEKSTKEMTDEELVESIGKIQHKIMEALDQDKKSMAYFYLGAATSVIFELQTRHKKTASDVGKDWYFFYDEESTEDYNFPGIYIFAVVSKKFYDKHGHLDDQHISNSLPKEVQKVLGGETMESFFEMEGTSSKECIKKLTNLGLQQLESI